MVWKCVCSTAVSFRPREQADKARGKEVCSGLDEAGNDLGDISLGFFLRQVINESQGEATTFIVRSVRSLTLFLLWVDRPENGANADA